MCISWGWGELGLKPPCGLALPTLLGPLCGVTWSHQMRIPVVHVFCKSGGGAGPAFLTNQLPAMWEGQGAGRLQALSSLSEHGIVDAKGLSSCGVLKQKLF